MTLAADINAHCDAIKALTPSIPSGGSPSFPPALDCWNPLTNMPGMEIPPSSFMTTLMTNYVRMQANIKDGTVLLLGDSNIQQLAASALTVRAENLAMGGQDTRQLLNHINALTANRRAGALVIGAGVCDLGEVGVVGQNGYVFYNTPAEAAGTVIVLWNNYIIPRMRATGKYVIREIIPVNESLAQPVTNAAVETVNAYWRTTFATWPNVRVVSAAGVTLRDGLHADDAGNATQISRINAALTSLGL